MNVLKSTALAIAMSGMFAAGAVNAELIDFTDDVWGAPGSSANSATVAYTLPGNVTLTPSPTPLYFEGYDGPVGGPGGKVGEAFDLDGIGISDDELSPGEKLTVSFDNAVTVTGLSFLDLYKSGSPPRPDGDGGDETARVEFFLNGVSLGTQSFVAIDPNPPAGNGGYLAVTFQGIVADELVFDLDPMTGRDDPVADYAVASITVVPIPAAAWLFGSALLGMVGIGVRRNKKA